MTVEVITFGCRLNQNESAVIKKQAEDASLKDTIIFNSCAVTSEAERQLRQSIRKARKSNPDKSIIVTGCAAQINPDRYAKMVEVDRVIGNTEKMIPETYGSLREYDSQKIAVNDIMSIKETAHYLASASEGRSRAFLQIQNGCNHRCTFCIIPYGRGNSRSVPLGEIIDNTKRLLDEGFKEIVLTGVDITDYGLDLPGRPSFTNMLRRLIKQVPDLKRLRLSSIDVAELDDDFIDLFCSNDVLMPHLHLSLQSGDNMILKRMKRRHTREQIFEFCQTVKKIRPETEFGADIIAGFPTETDDMFFNTLNLVKELKIGHLHIFPYSERIGTPAAKMPQLPMNLRKSRAAVLREVGSKILRESHSAKIGKIFNVLIENSSKGKAEDFSIVHVSGVNQNHLNQVVECKILDSKADYLVGEIISAI